MNIDALHLGFYSMDFYSLLAAVIYFYTSYHYKKNKQTDRAILFFGIATMFLLLKIFNYNIELEVRNLAWGMFNIVLAVFIMHDSDKTVAALKKKRKRK